MDADAPAALESSSRTDPAPWHSFTPRSAAGIAAHPEGRLCRVQCCVALFVAAACVWLLHHQWVPAIGQAIARLPHPGGSVKGGLLHWPEARPRMLTPVDAPPFLHVIVDPLDEEDHSLIADIQVELRERSLQVSSLFGFVRVGYPQGWDLKLDREWLGPWWESRRPFLLAALGAGVVAVLLLMWNLLAFGGAWMVRAFALFADRQASFMVCWRLAAAALMPGAVVLGMGILCYSMELLPLTGLVVVYALHLLITGAYWVAAPFFLPPLGSAASASNPFAEAAQASPAPAPLENPFGSGDSEGGGPPAPVA